MLMLHVHRNSCEKKEEGKNAIFATLGFRMQTILSEVNINRLCRYKIACRIQWLRLIKSSETVPFSRYFCFCNVLLVLHKCNVRAILTYRVHRLHSLCLHVPNQFKLNQVYTQCTHLTGVIAHYYARNPLLINSHQDVGYNPDYIIG